MHGCNFEQWKEEYGISYESPESDRKHKFQFCKNCLFVKTYQGSFTMKIGPTTAMNEEELAGIFILKKITGLFPRMMKKDRQKKLKLRRLLRMQEG